MLTRKDFLASIKSGKAWDNWKLKTREEVCALLDSNVARMVGFDQRNPHHCYNLFEHCLRTVDNLPKEAVEEELLLVAAFFHDLGKPVVAKEKQGRLVFYGHAKESAVLAEPILRRLGYEEKELQEILFLVAHHDDFINYAQAEEMVPNNGKVLISKENLSRYFGKILKANPQWTEKELKIVLEKLLQLCIADAASQSEEVYMQGKLVATRAGKIAKLNAIQKLGFSKS